jgi:2-isopropylmalate synthase
LGKHSGRHAFEKRLGEMGVTLSETELARTFEKFKDLADKKKNVYEEDLVSLIEEEIQRPSEVWQMDSVSYASGTRVKPSATVRLRKQGKTLSASSTGDGPVDACYKAIEKITKTRTRLLDYRIEAVTSGEDAMGEVAVRVQSGKKIAMGRGSSTDIIEASAKAFLNAVNKIASKEKKATPFHL